MKLSKKKELDHLINHSPGLEIVKTALCEMSLRHYAREAWNIISPKIPLIWNWHLDAICDHLEAVTYGQISYLLINIPPRETKSSTVSVLWPTWEWGPADHPYMRYIYSSYAQGLSTRDALKSRRILQSDWYQDRWGDRFIITSDQNTKTRYDNDQGGYRIATSVGGLATGEGGNRIVVDDPNNVKQVESETIREGTNSWWDESMATRLDDEDNGAYIIIAQRTHMNDLCGHVIEKWKRREIDDLVTLILPARYEKERELHLRTRSPLEFKDPRTYEGQPLNENRFPEDKLTKREKRMTEYARAGQLQQRPSPRGGGMFKIENFIPVVIPQPLFIEKSVRYWDKAGTEGGGSFTSGTLMHKMKKEFNGPKFIIADVKMGQWSTATREAIIKQTTELDGAKVEVGIEQEPGSGGKESAENTVINLAGYVVRKDKVTGSKESRADAYSIQVENKNVGIVAGDWNPKFLSHHENFPMGNLPKDSVDSTSGAFRQLMFGGKKTAGVWGR